MLRFELELKSTQHLGRQLSHWNPGNIIPMNNNLYSAHCAKIIAMIKKYLRSLSICYNNNGVFLAFKSQTKSKSSHIKRPPCQLGFTHCSSELRRGHRNITMKLLLVCPFFSILILFCFKSNQIKSYQIKSNQIKSSQVKSILIYSVCNFDSKGSLGFKSCHS